MSCPAPLQNEEKKDDTVETSSEDESSFKRTTLRFLNQLISDSASILEDAEDVLTQCNFDRKTLFEILSLTSKQTLIQFIEEEWFDWCFDIKDASYFRRIANFANRFVKEGKIVMSLKFLLMLQKEFTLLFKSGVGSFVEFQNCYEKVDKFQTASTANKPLFNVKIDALILWLEENQETLKVSEHIVIEGIEEKNCNSKFTSAFTENLEEFCNDLKERLIKSMLIRVDDTARILGLCLPYDSMAQNSGALLLEKYSQNPELKKNLNYIASFCNVNLSKKLEELEEAFQARVVGTKCVDRNLGVIKRILYLNQNLDPKIYFALGFCSGDGIHWRRNMLLDASHYAQPNVIIDHFISRKEFHTQLISDSVYRLQKSRSDQGEDSIYLGKVSVKTDNDKWAKDFSVGIFDFLKKEISQNTVAMSFVVKLYAEESNEMGHEISFCRFFRMGVEVWRIRDLNCGEFEGSFQDLKEWYSNFFYPASCYATSWQYNSAFFKKLIVASKKTDTFFNDDEQCRSLMIKNFLWCNKSAFFTHDLVEASLELYQKIIYPTIRDNLIKNVMLYFRYQYQIISDPKKGLLNLEASLEQFSERENLEMHTFKSVMQLSRLVALFRDNQLDAFNINFSKTLSSINPKLFGAENAMVKEFFNERCLLSIEKFEAILTKEEIFESKEKIEQARESLRKSLEDVGTTIEKTLEELTLMNPGNRATFKKLLALLNCYTTRIGWFIGYANVMFEGSVQPLTGIVLEGEDMPLLLTRGMETFINALSEEQVPRPLTFMRTLQSEIYNQKWVPEDKGLNQLSERKKHRYRCCPGIVDTP